MIRVKRVYDRPERGDGIRILVDRLWPRGLSKARAKVDVWMKAVSPSPDLRKWFSHDPEKWLEFKRRYFAELDKNREMVREIARMSRRGAVTLLYGSREERFNNAQSLAEYVRKRA